MNVLEKILEEIKNNAKLGNMRLESVRIEKVEEIIRSHMDDGKDTNDDWIPVSERQPEGGKEVLAQWEFRDKYDGMTYVYIDKLWINKMTGEWTGNLGVPRGNVVAWQPLPEVYKGEMRMENPANAIKDTMWYFLMDKGQRENIPELKESVYRLIQITTQKTAGQEGYKKKEHIDWNSLDMELMRIVIEATSLVLSGRLEELEYDDKDINVSTKTVENVVKELEDMFDKWGLDEGKKHIMREIVMSGGYTL